MSELQISSESLKRVDVVQVNGRIDSSTAPEFDDALQTIMNNNQYNIVLNLAGVSYMSSAGLRVLVGTLRECKKHRGKVVLADTSDRVSEVLDLAGLTTLFDVYPDETTAVGSF